MRRRVEESGDEGVWRGGVIVDTPADFAKKERHSMITKCVREFEGEPETCCRCLGGTDVIYFSSQCVARRRE